MFALLSGGCNGGSGLSLRGRGPGISPGYYEYDPKLLS